MTTTYRPHIPSHSRTDYRPAFVRLAEHLTRDGTTCDEFTYAGNTEGRSGARYETGRLPGDWARTYAARRHLITYTVVSYGTPIGWHDAEAGWIIPAESYSVTTSRAQNVLRAALSSCGIAYQD